MKFLRLKARGLIGLAHFPGGGVDIDFTALPPGLIAVVAENGSGKTTILECLYALFHLDMPSRDGYLHDQFVPPGGEIEGWVQLGPVVYHAVIKVRISITAKGRSNSTEAFLYADDVPLAKGGGVTEYRQAIESVFIPAGLSLATWFACQTKDGSFPDLSKQQKKQLVVRSLNLGVLQRIAKAAHDRATSAGKDIDGLAERVRSLDSQMAAVDSAVRDLLGTPVAVPALEAVR